MLFESRLLIALALAHMAGLAGKQPPIPTSRDLPVPVYLIIGLQTSLGTSSFKKKYTLRMKLGCSFLHSLSHLLTPGNTLSTLF